MTRPLAPLPGLVERSFVVNIPKPKIDQPVSTPVGLLVAQRYSSGHLWLSNLALDIFSLSGVYFVLFKSPALPNAVDRWVNFDYPTKIAPAVTEVTLQTRNVILAGVCSGSTGQPTSYHSSLRVSLGSRDQVFVMLGFPNSALWDDTGTSVAMCLTCVLTPSGNHDKP
jgi:hypothetical protein